MSPGVILGLGITLLIVGWILRKMADKGGVNSGEAVRLIKKIQNDDNKDQIENAVTYHNSRIANGANARESCERLIRDLRRIGGMDEQPE